MMRSVAHKPPPPAPSDLDPPRLVPSAPASWQRVSTRTPPPLFWGIQRMGPRTPVPIRILWGGEAWTDRSPELRRTEPTPCHNHVSPDSQTVHLLCEWQANGFSAIPISNRFPILAPQVGSRDSLLNVQEKMVRRIMLGKHLCNCRSYRMSPSSLCSGADPSGDLPGGGLALRARGMGGSRWVSHSQFAQARLAARWRLVVGEVEFHPSEQHHTAGGAAQLRPAEFTRRAPVANPAILYQLAFRAGGPSRHRGRH